MKKSLEGPVWWGGWQESEPPPPAAPGSSHQLQQKECRVAGGTQDPGCWRSGGGADVPAPSRPPGPEKETLLSQLPFLAFSLLLSHERPPPPLPHSFCCYPPLLDPHPLLSGKMFCFFSQEET